MRKLLIFGVILLFTALAFAGSADASHEKHVIRYVGGGASGYGVFFADCIWTVDDTTYAVGGSCQRSCPDGTCDITVVDDQSGKNIRFRIQVNNEEFFRPQVYFHKVSVEGDFISVAVAISGSTTGTITIE